MLPCSNVRALEDCAEGEKEGLCYLWVEVAFAKLSAGQIWGGIERFLSGSRIVGLRYLRGHA